VARERREFRRHPRRWGGTPRRGGGGKGRLLLFWAKPCVSLRKQALRPLL
jgi:hypothetical protein